MGAWSGAACERAVAHWAAGDRAGAAETVASHDSLRARVVRAAMSARSDPAFAEDQAREETTRVAKAELVRARAGLRLLDIVVTIAPLLGLLGTVFGMIAAFQTLQQSGAQADPSDLAGGIWEALLTTAAGMGVAIPAAIALSWFESVVDRVQTDMEDLATRIFTRGG
jgi:biopolymer transport protein ExbB